MYETLFKQRAILTRYQEAPFAEAREQFLRQCAACGYSRSTLKKIAWILVSLTYVIDLDQAELTRADIECAVDGRMCFNSLSRLRQTAPGTRRMFIHFAMEWVKSVGRLAPDRPPAHPFTGQISAFCKYCREERGLSPVTIATARERLNWFFQSVDVTLTSLQTIRIGNIDAFLQSMGNRGWTRASLGALASSLRSFFRYAEGQGWSTAGIAAAIESPHCYTREGLPQGPGWEDVLRLLGRTREEDSPAAIRDYAVLILLAVYGLRRGEVARLQLEDIDWLGERISVSRSKQSRVQHYPLTAVAGDAILRYLKEVRPVCKERAVFLALSAPVRPLSALSITAIAHARLTALGIALPRRGAHCLRHACARHLLAEGFTLKEIGDHLGHRSANSTLTYTKIDLTGLRQVAELDMGWLL